MRIDHIMVLNNKIKVTYEWNTVRSTAAFCNTYITNQITQIGFRLDSYAAYSDIHNITDKLFVAVRWDKRAGVVFDKIFYQNDVSWSYGGFCGQVGKNIGARLFEKLCRIKEKYNNLRVI